MFFPVARAVPAAEESVTELEAENVVAYITRIVLDELREILSGNFCLRM